MQWAAYLPDQASNSTGDGTAKPNGSLKSDTGQPAAANVQPTKRKGEAAKQPSASVDGPQKKETAKEAPKTDLEKKAILPGTPSPTPREEYKSLEQVKEEIRDLLAQQKAREKIMEST